VVEVEGVVDLLRQFDDFFPFKHVQDHTRQDGLMDEDGVAFIFFVKGLEIGVGVEVVEVVFPGSHKAHLRPDNKETGVEIGADGVVPDAGFHGEDALLRHLAVLIDQRPEFVQGLVVNGTQEGVVDRTVSELDAVGEVEGSRGVEDEGVVLDVDEGFGFTGEVFFGGGGGVGYPGEGEVFALHIKVHQADIEVNELFEDIIWGWVWGLGFENVKGDIGKFSPVGTETVGKQ
jgi:hypothetical protein